MRNEESNRRFHRVNLQTPLSYQIRGQGQLNHALSDNVSIGGLSFTNNRFIVPNTCLMLQLNVLSKIVHPIARISRVSSLARSDRYQVGVEFIEFDFQEKKHLVNYIDMCFM